MPVEGPLLRNGMVLLVLQDRGIAIGLQQPPGRPHRMAQSEPIQALQFLQAVLPFAVTLPQPGLFCEHFVGTLVKPKVDERTFDNCMYVIDVAFGLLPAGGYDGDGLFVAECLERHVKVDGGTLRPEKKIFRHVQPSSTCIVRTMSVSALSTTSVS